MKPACLMNKTTEVMTDEVTSLLNADLNQTEELMENNNGNQTHNGLDWDPDALLYSYLVAWTIIIVVGLVANTGGVLIAWCKPRVRRIAPIQWLLAIGIADNIMLLALSMNVLDEINYRNRLNIWMWYDWLCKTNTYLPYAMSTLSSWLIVGISVERALVVAKPFSIHTVISVFRVRLCILVLVILACALSGWTIETTWIEHEPVPHCASNQTFYDDYEPFIIFDGFAAFFLPWFLVLLSNIFTLTKVCKADRNRESLMMDMPIVYSNRHTKTYRNGQSRKITISLNGVETHLPVSAVLRRFRRDTTETTDSVRARKTAIQPPHRKRGSGGSTGSVKSNVTNRPATEQQLQVQTQQHRKVLSLLSKITMMYLLLNIPYYCFRFQFMWFPFKRETYESYEYQLMQKVAHLMYYCQFGLNFLIYAPKYAIHSVRNSRIGQQAIRQWSRYTKRYAGKGPQHSGRAIKRSNKGHNKFREPEHSSLLTPLDKCPAYIPPSASDDEIIRKQTIIELAEIEVHPADVDEDFDSTSMPKKSTFGADLRYNLRSHGTRSKSSMQLSPAFVRHGVEDEDPQRRSDSYIASTSGQPTDKIETVMETSMDGGTSTARIANDAARTSKSSSSYERKATNFQVANNLLAVTIEREWYNTHHH